MTIELTPEIEQLVQVNAKRDGVDASAYVTRVLKEVLRERGTSNNDAQEVPARRRTISERFEEIREQLTVEEREALDQLPSDLAAEHDHYIYGTPKEAFVRTLFADTFFWTALVDRSDQWHETVVRYEASLSTGTAIVTTEEVLVEFATLLGTKAERLRRAASRFTRDVLANPSIEVIPQSHESFLEGLALFEARPDKLYSLTDCISMQTMKRREISEVLTHDRHFTQEGLQAIFH